MLKKKKSYTVTCRGKISNSRSLGKNPYPTKGRAIIFLTLGGGGGWEFAQGNIYLYAAPAANKLLVSPSSCKHSFLLVYHLFQCLQPISKFSTPLAPPF